MSTVTGQPRSLPSWLLLIGSLAIVFHLTAVTVMVLAARSGRWPSFFGPTMQEPPPFAADIGEYTSRYYLQPLHLAHNYHFVSNRVDLSAVRFEVRLKEEDGTVFKTLSFPEEDANAWVRLREGLLAQNLGDDEPPVRGGSNVLPAPGKEVERVKIWEPAKEGSEFQLKTVPVTAISRDRPVNGPSRWSQLVAESYVRYVVRKYGAASGELVRHSREPVPPVVLFMPQDQWPPDFFREMVADFTERQP